jgi:hypothetical protein
MNYTEPRFTKDLDLWIAIDKTNAQAVYSALSEFGAPLAKLTAEDFTREGYFYQMGRAPFRLDIMMSIPAVKFESAWKGRVEVKIEDISVPFIARKDLMASKKSSGRPQDLIDLDKLEKVEQDSSADN